jgi:alpha-beta hydrolase superfamily lysophospholipase
MKKIKKFILVKSIGMYINLMSYARPEKATRLAYRFFSEPRLGRLSRNSLPPVLQDAVIETTAINGGEFQTYVWKGNDNVILLVHGWESNASRWELMLPHLRSSGSTIVAIDGPAHGLSGGKEFNVPAYAEFIDATVQKYKPSHLIGHSLGGAACIYYQYKYQNKGIQKMVILGAPSDLQILVRNYVTLLSLNSRIVSLLEQHFVDKFKFRIDEFSGKLFGSALNIKGIIAHDVDDSVVSFEEGRKIAGSWKHARFIETKGLGHSMHDDSLYRKVTDFLGEK